MGVPSKALKYTESDIAVSRGECDKPIEPSKYEQFCQRYVVDFNGAKAYREAGFDINQDDEKSAVYAASACAWRLLKNAKVQERIRYLAKQQEKAVFESTQGTIKQRIIDALNSKVTDYMRWDENGSVSLKPAHMLDNVELIQECSIEGDKVRIKLMNKDKALEHLAKIEKLLVDSHEISGELMVRQQIEANEAYKRRMAKLDKNGQNGAKTRENTRKKQVKKVKRRKQAKNGD